MNEEERQKYYRYDVAKAETMVHHAVPYLDPMFNKELESIFGKDAHGDPILRIVWAGKLREEKWHLHDDGITRPYDGMKYPYMKRKVITGYTYTNDKGQKITVTSKEAVPKDKPFVDSWFLDELGVMKWVIEMKYTAEHLIEMGYYPASLYSKKIEQWCVKDGQRYRFKPKREGEYLKAFFIETPESVGQAHFGYRDVRSSDIDAIKEVIYRAQNESDEDFTKRKMNEIEQMLELEEEKKMDKFDNALEDAIIRAQKLPVDRVFFAPRK